ncbi:MAG: hypothetical protein KatS3mg118_0426 [Paracoccaceae bacterium]|nr:MAG: hypothetical protein KatS3mg118_0426 [Paracoccaceae bacterium]
MNRGLPAGGFLAPALVVGLSLALAGAWALWPEALANLGRAAGRVLPPDPAVLARSMPEMAETVLIVLGGTALAAAGAALAAAGVMALPAPLAVLPRLALALARALPAIVLAGLIVAAGWGGAPAGLAAIALHGAGRLAPDWLAAAAAIDRAPARALIGAGASALQGFRHADWPQMLPRLVRGHADALARALRDGLVVGLVGAGGIGGPLFDAIAAGALREVSALALAALAALLVVEAAGRRLARRLG